MTFVYCFLSSKYKDNSVLLAPCNFTIERANSITVICMPKQMAGYGILAHILQQEFSLRLLCLQNLLARTHHMHPEVQIKIRSDFYIVGQWHVTRGRSMLTFSDSHAFHRNLQMKRYPNQSVNSLRYKKEQLIRH